MVEENLLSRRKFLGHSLAGTAAAAATTIGVLRPNRVLGANDRVRVVVVGPGDRAKSLIGDFRKAADELNMEIAGVCDIWKQRREQGVEQLKKWGVPEPLAFRNTDELYEHPDVDAVIIATADFQHAWMAKEAVEHGKDVYVEKPFAHFIEDAREARKVIANSDRIVQVGTQRRSGGTYKAAAEFVRRGEFGSVCTVEMSWNVNQGGRWRRPSTVEALREEETDWKRFRLHLEKRGFPFEPFDARKEIEFRLFWPYSSGLPDQWMSHQIDIVPWITGDPYPSSCVASGALYTWKDGREVPDTFSCVFEYPKGFQVNYTARQNQGFGGTKEVFLSNKGALYPGNATVTGEGGGRDRLEEIRLIRPPSDDHMKNWMECIRSRKTPNADIEAAYQHSVALCMAVESLHKGRRVTFNPETHQIEES